MPVFRATIEKYYATVGEYWTNVYHVNRPTIEEAVTSMDGIVQAERSVLDVTCIVTKGRVDDNTIGTDISFGKSYNLPGLYGTNTDLLPLFVTARVDLSVADGGRPLRKYLRGIVSEGEVTMTTINAQLTGELSIYGMALASQNVCSPDGSAVVGGVVWPAPAMRQLRRGSKKKVTP